MVRPARIAAPHRRCRRWLDGRWSWALASSPLQHTRLCRVSGRRHPSASAVSIYSMHGCACAVHAVRASPLEAFTLRFIWHHAHAGRQLAKLTQQEYSGVPLVAAAEMAVAAVVLLYGALQCSIDGLLNMPHCNSTISSDRAGPPLLTNMERWGVDATECVLRASLVSCAASLRLSGDLKPISSVNSSRCGSISS